MTSSAGHSLTPEQRSQFDRDGYLVIKDFFTTGDAETLRGQASKLLKEFDLDSHPKTRFSTGEKSDHVGDEYFLSSGDKIRFFFEEDAFSPVGELTVPKEQAINKIGHGLHIIDPKFKEFSTRDAVKEVVNSLGFKDPEILQSMLIFKQPRIGGRVPPHQDSTFLYTKPMSAVGLWFALEDCTPENGCMYFLAGSHKTCPVQKRFVRKPDNKGTTFIDLTDTVVAEPPESDYTCAAVPIGSLVLIHGSVLHKSGHNSSDKSRWIYTFHCIEGEAEYPADNWLQPTAEHPFTKLNRL